MREKHLENAQRIFSVKRVWTDQEVCLDGLGRKTMSAAVSEWASRCSSQWVPNLTCVRTDQTLIESSVCDSSCACLDKLIMCLDKLCFKPRMSSFQLISSKTLFPHAIFSIFLRVLLQNLRFWYIEASNLKFDPEDVILEARSTFSPFSLR
jgi:hypothetical protein